VIRHPFFDQDQGRKYNVQSAVMLASPIVMLLSCVLAHASYNAYTSSLFPEDEEESGSLFGGGFSGGPYGGTGGFGGNQRPNGPPPSSGRSGGAAPRIFQGSGQRLGG
ncbi:unnamed protein product, partial [Polarella glacialis]